MGNDADCRTGDPRFGTGEKPRCSGMATTGVPCRMSWSVGMLTGRSGHRQSGCGISCAAGGRTGCCCFPAAAATGVACGLSATTAGSFRTNQSFQRVPHTVLLSTAGGRRKFEARRFRVRPSRVRHRQTEQPEHKTDQRAAAHHPSADLSPERQRTPGSAGQSIPTGVKRQAHGNSHGEANGGPSNSITDSRPSGPPGSDGLPPCTRHHNRPHGTSQRGCSTILPDIETRYDGFHNAWKKHVAG